MSRTQQIVFIETPDDESQRAPPCRNGHPPHHGGHAMASPRLQTIRSMNSLRSVEHDPLLLPSLSSSMRRQYSGYGTIGSMRSITSTTNKSPQTTTTTRPSLRAAFSSESLIQLHRDAAAPLNPAAPAPVTPYHVSTARRIAQVVVTVLACWLASGIVFGFAALKPILLHQGVYREFCTVEELAASVPVCRGQDLRLNAFFAIASTTCNIAALPAGALLDRYGARATTSIGCMFLAIGSALMAAAFAVPTFDWYMVGNVFLALGGSFIYVPSYAIANAFPAYAGTIVALVTGAFDASAAVFLFYRLAYEATGGAISPVVFFAGYMVVPAAILLAQWTLMEGGGYKSSSAAGEKQLPTPEALCEAQNVDHDQAVGEAHERAAHETSGVWGALHGLSALQQIQTPWFVLITLLTILQMLRMNFFIATVHAQYEVMLGSSHLAKQINAFFDIALPVGGVAATPLIGLLLDHTSTAGMLTVLVAFITAVGVFGSLPFVWAAYTTVILFVLLRPLYYSAMSDYATKIFGFNTFGQVYGLIICCAGLINLSQPWLDELSHDVFHKDPVPINAAFGVLGFAFGTALVLFVWMHQRRATTAAARNATGEGLDDWEKESLIGGWYEDHCEAEFLAPNQGFWTSEAVAEVGNESGLVPNGIIVTDFDEES